MTRNKSYGLSRRTETRLPHTRFVVFSEGLNTEPAYLTTLGNTLSRVLVKLKIFGGAGDPKTLADKALAFKKGSSGSGRRDASSFEKNDQIWIMFDRDEHDKVKETIDNFKKAGIRVAYSNPCFELWLILHYEDFDRSYDRHKLQGHFEGLCESYSKKGNKKPDCNSFIGNVESAELRAQAMLARRRNENAEFGAPYTNVHELTSAMRQADQRQINSKKR
ncbi:RloB family protein [Agrobacterium rosae]|uniref:RloB family protein n=1 Tax=Agrobacterium rosae TaxID=1972867 RepID=UPI00122F0280|nr:RloB family protein [Agrobacterium rosae]KAA3510074.1 RloB domain-containing protein [Agrobacterium rosae]KAA3514981.1 RloB domain-containing protein [Agrobacterium rosae]MQB50693.1 RloB domain-containing protein [Agrobacterium rosae]